MMKSALDSLTLTTAGVIALAVLLGILAVFISTFTADTSLLGHFFTYLFPRYIKDTAIVTLSVCILCAFIGSTLAFLVANFDFLFSRTISILLMLPLAIPAYILAFIYVGIMDYDGIFKQIFGFRFDIFNIYGAILVLTLSLYPYVYMFARASFASEAKTIFDVAYVMRLSRWQTFWRISIFITRPAIISGLMLVLMETLSDYGTAAYFGIDTFSAGIFKLWFDLRDLGSASILASILVFIVFLIMLAEYKAAHAKKYSLRSDSGANMKKIKLRGLAGFMAFVYCIIFAFLGFIMPFIWLFYWGLHSDHIFSLDFYKLALNSLSVALISAIIITLVAFFLNFACRLTNLNLIKIFILKCSSVGYAMPGAVIGVSMMLCATWVANIFDIRLLGISLSVLIVGYLIRYLATSVLSFESGYHKIHSSIDESSKIMKLPLWKLATLHLPLLRHFFILSLIVVFVDIVKELPLSLILRPFDFETLSIRAFFYATDERIYDAALPALLIVSISLIALLYIELRRDRG